jgi:hypothetical protein
MRPFFLTLLILEIGLLTGCATMADTRDARGQGSSQTFSATFDVVWKAVPEALSAIGLSVATESKGDGYVLAERGATLFSWGEKVAVFVAKANVAETKVEVVSKRVLATNIIAPNWESEVLLRIAQLLAKEKQ